MEQFLAMIAGHGTFLLLVLPVIGALLVLLSAPWGPDVVIRTAVTNVVFSLVIGALMLIQFDPKPTAKSAELGIPRFQMSSSSSLEKRPPPETGRQDSVRRPLMQIVVGVDGLNLWIITLIPVVTLASITLARNARHLTAYLAVLLFMQAALTGLFSALNVIFFIVCFEISTLLLLLLIGCWGNPDHRREVLPMAVLQLAGSLLVVFGLAAMVLAHYWLTADITRNVPPLNFSMVALIAELPPKITAATPAAVIDSWRSAETMIFWTLLLGFGVKSAVFPFHREFCASGTVWPASISVFAHGVFPCIGIYGVLRFVSPVCETPFNTYGPLLVHLALLGSMYCGLLALGQSELKRTVSYASVAHTGLALAAALSHTAAGISAAVFHLIAHIAGFAVLVAVIGSLNDRYDTLEIRAFGGMFRKLPWMAMAYFLAAFAVCGISGLCGFPALWQTVVAMSGLIETGQSSMFVVLLTLVVCGLLAWAFLSAGQRIFWGPLREPLQDSGFFTPIGIHDLQIPETRRSAEIRDWLSTERLGVVLLSAVLVTAGLAPQFVADRIDSAMSHLRPRKPETRQVIHVQAVPAPRREERPL